jgi:uncharacterized membrane protein
MKHINTNRLSEDECWSVQINGLDWCKSCKWTGITACEGHNILKVGYNSKGWKIGKNGITEEQISREEYTELLKKKALQTEKPSN